ncbi:hypothetical protein [Herbaspirillum sp. RV1423]|uniref:hypothetical protein n=1 Tax=Herbaspirillum sp. RV1423 TaxID=1443993 RepID=UPI0012DC5AD9|nr:hypothetical protein [Herbaspirillum sp. RV1423]
MEQFHVDALLKNDERELNSDTISSSSSAQTMPRDRLHCRRTRQNRRLQNGKNAAVFYEIQHENFPPTASGSQADSTVLSERFE